MGCNHATTGALVGLATLPLAPVDDAVGTAVWVLGWAGTALLSDLDSSGSSAARMWGVPTQLLGGAIGRVAGGHRRGTHDLVLAPALAGGAAWLVSWSSIGQVVVLALLLGLMLRAMAITGGPVRLRGALVNAGLSWAGAWWLVDQSASAQVSAMVPWMVAGGIVVHVLGDAMTRSGVPVPVAWITDRSRTWSLGLFRTGAGFETWVLTPLLNLAFLGALIWSTDLARAWDLLTQLGA